MRATPEEVSTGVSLKVNSRVARPISPEERSSNQSQRTSPSRLQVRMSPTSWFATLSRVGPFYCRLSEKRRLPTGGKIRGSGLGLNLTYVSAFKLEQSNKRSQDILCLTMVCLCKIRVACMYPPEQHLWQARNRHHCLQCPAHTYSTFDVLPICSRAAKSTCYRQQGTCCIYI